MPFSHRFVDTKKVLAADSLHQIAIVISLVVILLVLVCFQAEVRFSLLRKMSDISSSATSSPRLLSFISPIYATEKKNGSGPIEKLVRTRYFCRVNFPYHVFMKRIRTRFFLAFWPQAGLWPQNRKKKTSPDPFCCSKALFKRIFVPYHVLHVRLPCFTVVSRMCTIALLNHEPNLIVTSVNG